MSKATKILYVKGTWAIIIGRFQPFHVEHARMFDYILEKTNITKVVVLLGEQRDSGKDPLHYMHRANMFNRYLEGKFEDYRIAPMYDIDGSDEDWADDVHANILNTLIGSSQMTDYVLFAATKITDHDENGYHYVDSLAGIMDVHKIPVQDENINATAIRNDPKKNFWMVENTAKDIVSLNINGAPANNEAIFNEKWMRVFKTVPKNGGSFFYSSRRNRDSVAFVLKCGDYYGFIVEGKPPIGDIRCVSAFGGSFDSLQDNPYKLIKQEVLEEAGYGAVEIERIRFAGCYLATTQSDEIVHLYEVEVPHLEFDPQTVDEGEMSNEPVWLHKDDVWVVDDWKAQMIMR